MSQSKDRTHYIIAQETVRNEAKMAAQNGGQSVYEDTWEGHPRKETLTLFPETARRGREMQTNVEIFTGEGKPALTLKVRMREDRRYHPSQWKVVDPKK